MSPSKMRKTTAYSDGMMHADGGPDLRSRYKGEMLEAYDLGFRTQTEEAEAQREAYDHPLAQISRACSAMSSRAGNPDVRELADLVGLLAQHVRERT